MAKRHIKIEADDFKYLENLFKERGLEKVDLESFFNYFLGSIILDENYSLVDEYIEMEKEEEELSESDLEEERKWVEEQEKYLRSLKF